MRPKQDMMRHLRSSDRHRERSQDVNEWHLSRVQTMRAHARSRTCRMLKKNLPPFNTVNKGSGNMRLRIGLSGCSASGRSLSTILSTARIFWVYLRQLGIVRSCPFSLVKSRQTKWENVGISRQSSLARRCSTTELHPQTKFGGQQ
jgi:hypothetical protein